MSGSVLERPGLQRVLAEARAQRYELLLVYRVDRLACSVRGLSEILHALDKRAPSSGPRPSPSTPVAPPAA
jgi:site-specific DNA recombinase